MKTVIGFLILTILKNSQATNTNLKENQLELLTVEPSCDLEEYRNLESDLSLCLNFFKRSKGSATPVQKNKTSQKSSNKKRYNDIKVKYDAMKKFSEDFHFQMEEISYKLSENFEDLNLKDKKILDLDSELSHKKKEWEAKYAQMMKEMNLLKQQNDEWAQAYTNLEAQNENIRQNISINQTSLIELTTNVDLTKKEVKQWELQCGLISNIKKDTHTNQVIENKNQLIGDLPHVQDDGWVF
jgi:chromosome segregation ATPase